jgi:predicted RNase H-like nuclease (RuvC/YqgF family)
MSGAEDEPSGYIDREESINEGNGNGEARNESKVFGSDQDNVGEGEGQPLPEGTSQTSERPTGVEEDRILQSQEEAAAESKEQRRSPKPSEDKLVSKLQNDLKKQVDRTRSLQDSVKGTQSQLTRIDKTLYSFRKEHQVDRSKSIQDSAKGIQKQLNLLQKRVDSIDKSIRTWKSKMKATKRKTKPKLVKKKK